MSTTYDLREIVKRTTVTQHVDRHRVDGCEFMSRHNAEAYARSLREGLIAEAIREIEKES